MHNFVNSAPFALFESCCLKFEWRFKQQNFLLRPTQLVAEHKENFNAQSKTPNNTDWNN